MNVSPMLHVCLTITLDPTTFHHHEYTLPHYVGFVKAPSQGFEPRFQRPERRVLPLNELGMDREQRFELRLLGPKPSALPLGDSRMVLPEGIEPPSAGCKPAALPLDERSMAVCAKGRPTFWQSQVHAIWYIAPYAPHGVGSGNRTRDQLLGRQRPYHLATPTLRV
jgi:hypothetical protein